jgi:hypothetical protein
VASQFGSRKVVVLIGRDQPGSIALPEMKTHATAPSPGTEAGMGVIQTFEI